MKTKQQQRSKWEQIIFTTCMLGGIFQIGYGFYSVSIFLIVGGLFIALTSLGLLATSTPK
jgi:hypothetical protein